MAKVYPSPRHRESDRGGIEVRIIEYTLHDPGRTGDGQKHRLMTTLMDEHLDPATDLVVLYHQRWEEEMTIDEWKTHQRERPVLRSQTPSGVVQEISGLSRKRALPPETLAKTIITISAPRSCSTWGDVRRRAGWQFWR